MHVEEHVNFCVLFLSPTLSSNFRVMASKKSRDLQQRVWQQKTEATAAYDAKDSATRDEMKWEVEMSEELKMAYLKAVIKCPLAENLRQNQDLALREMIKIFEIYANNEAKAKALATSEEYTDEQMQEDMIKRTVTPFFSWFQKHVRRSARRSFTPEYLVLGLVEEVSKYKRERRKVEAWPPVGKELDEVICRAGNIYWYIYGLCGALEDVVPETVEDDGYDWFHADFKEVVGRLCGTIKDYTAGGEDWVVLRPRVQAHVSRVLRHVAGGAVCPAEEAMRVNIAKIRGKKE